MSSTLFTGASLAAVRTLGVPARVRCPAAVLLGKVILGGMSLMQVLLGAALL